MRHVDDWARVSPEDMAGLYAQEAERWRAELDWDTAETWDTLERARREGRVPGFVVRHANGAIAGWTYYLLHGRELQIGTMTSSSPGTTSMLLEAVLASPAALVAHRVLFFAFTQAPEIGAALTARGFDVGRERYLTCRLTPDQPASRAVRIWHGDDLDAVASVLRAAYGGPDPCRAFAPGDTCEEWRAYVQQIALTGGCGRFLPALSQVAPGTADGLDGVALVTAVSPLTAHLAQLAVRPQAAGRGLGARLLATVRADAAAAGYTRLSLLVSEGNTRAQRLYARAGFTGTATFTAATRLVPGPGCTPRETSASLQRV